MGKGGLGAAVGWASTEWGGEDPARGLVPSLPQRCPSATAGAALPRGETALGCGWIGEFFGQKGGFYSLAAPAFYVSSPPQGETQTPGFSVAAELGHCVLLSAPSKLLLRCRGGFFFSPKVYPFSSSLLFYFFFFFLFLILPFFSPGEEKWMRAETSWSRNTIFHAKSDHKLGKMAFSHEKTKPLPFKMKISPLFQHRGRGGRATSPPCLVLALPQVGSRPGGGSGAGVAPAGPSAPVPASRAAPCRWLRTRLPAARSLLSAGDPLEPPVAGPSAGA